MENTRNLILPIRADRKLKKKSRTHKQKNNWKKVVRQKMLKNICLNYNKILNDCIAEGATIKFKPDIDRAIHHLNMVVMSAYEYQRDKPKENTINRPLLTNPQ